MSNDAHSRPQPQVEHDQRGIELFGAAVHVEPGPRQMRGEERRAVVRRGPEDPVHEGILGGAQLLRRQL